MQHQIRVKECYPYKDHLTRGKDGVLYPLNGTEASFQKSKEVFLKAYQRNVSLQKEMGLVNSTVTVSEFFMENNTCYIISEYKEGQTLDQLQDLPLEDSIILLCTITKIIQKYHDRGFLYLDVKPSNILSIPETKEHVVLFDFDSLYGEDDYQKMEDNLVSFTEGYASPEQVKGDIKKIGPWSDVYGLGVLLYESIFGTIPNYQSQLMGSSFEVQLESKKIDQYPMFVKNELNLIFKKTLSASIKRRWQDCDTLLEHLEMVRENLHKVALDNFLIAYGNKIINFDYTKEERALFLMHADSESEYYETMAVRTKETIVKMFSKEGRVILDFCNEYRDQFQNLTNEVILYLNIKEDSLKKEIRQVIEHKRKEFFEKIDSFLNFYQIQEMEISLKEEPPAKVKCVNLVSTRKKKWLDFFNDGPIDKLMKGGHT